jgi:4,5-dihydroxyphthalate decarboxylase
MTLAMTLRLTCACWSYDRTSALQTGAISPKDITLDYIALPPEQTFLRQLRDREFDISEMSLSAYITAREKGDDYFLALPIFPSRIFRHSAIYVNPRAGIKTPKDLRGKRVGVGFYQMTAWHDKPLVRELWRGGAGLFPTNAYLSDYAHACRPP